MHIFIAIVIVLMSVALWWNRLKVIRAVAGEAGEASAQLEGRLRRNRLRKKSALAPVEAIDDAVTAAATVILAIATEDVVMPELVEQRLRSAMTPIAKGEKHLNEVMVYARWASNQVADVPTVIHKTAAFLKPRLSMTEKEQLIAKVFAVTLDTERHAMFKQRILLLQRKLGLTVHG